MQTELLKNGTMILVDDNGVVYHMEQLLPDGWSEQTGIYTPLSEYNARYVRAQLHEGEKINTKAPYICKCLNRHFEVFASDDYETSIRCPKCGHTTVVHSG